MRAFALLMLGRQQNQKPEELVLYDAESSFVTLQVVNTLQSVGSEKDIW